MSPSRIPGTVPFLVIRRLSSPHTHCFVPRGPNATPSPTCANRKIAFILQSHVSCTRSSDYPLQRKDVRTPHVLLRAPAGRRSVSYIRVLASHNSSPSSLTSTALTRLALRGLFELHGVSHASVQCLFSPHIMGLIERISYMYMHELNTRSFRRLTTD